MKQELLEDFKAWKLVFGFTRSTTQCHEQVAGYLGVTLPREAPLQGLPLTCHLQTHSGTLAK